jgi:peptide/nickel transport system ATP-binding protein
MKPALLTVEDLHLSFPLARGRRIRPLDGLSFHLARGEILGIAGESGCGKSTLARALMGFYRPERGHIRIDGQERSGLKGKDLLHWQRKMQMVFQDPLTSLDPRQTIGDALMEPMDIHGLHAHREARRQQCRSLLQAVGLPASALERLPRQFSGGQLQRIGIARALSLEPEILIADEAVSALDVSIQAQIINLFRELRERMGLSIIFISHDLAVLRTLCDRMAVMQAGQFVEMRSTEELCRDPQHPYTRQLIAAIPRLRQRRQPSSPSTSHP